MSICRTVEAYLKKKIFARTMDVDFTKGKEYGIENTKFNFSAEPCRDPYGDVCFMTGYNNDDKYTSTFIMSAEEAMELGKMIIDVAYHSMDTKRILLEAEACDTRLSFLVLKGLIDAIRIERTDEKLLNYEAPYYYKYIVTAYKNNDAVYRYSIVYNLSYFTKKEEIDYWKDKLTDKGRVRLYFTNWDPYTECENRQKKTSAELLNKLKDLKPLPISK